MDQVIEKKYIWGSPMQRYEKWNAVSPQINVTIATVKA